MPGFEFRIREPNAMKASSAARERDRMLVTDRGPLSS